MDRRFGYFLFLGLVVGALFGLGFGSANGNALLGLGFGALGGVFLGWFLATIAAERSKPE